MWSVVHYLGKLTKYSLNSMNAMKGWKIQILVVLPSFLLPASVWKEFKSVTYLVETRLSKVPHETKVPQKGKLVVESNLE